MGIVRFLALRAVEGITIAILILIMPYVPPNAKFSKSDSVTSSLPLEGKLALNERLSGIEKWHEGDLQGPEAFAEYNGELYTTVHGGDVVKLVGDHIIPITKFGKPCKGIYQEHICGRPLGLTFDKNGNLYVSDAYYGIFKVDVKTGKKRHLVSVDVEIGGQKPKVPNSLAVASNGDIYWSDSSTEFTLQDGIFDMLADGSGRLIRYDAKTERNEVLMDGLHFANGVRLSDNEDYVLVAETARSRVHRYYLKGSKKGTNDLFLDGLPGLPDNINSDGQGGYLFPFVAARDYYHPNIFQVFSPFPLIRKFIARLLGLAELGFKIIEDIYPNEYSQRLIHFIGHFHSVPPVLMTRRVTILRVSKDGEILESLHSTRRDITGICDAFIFKDKLLLGSPFNNYIGRISLEEAALVHLKTTRALPKVTEKSPTTTTQKPTTTTQKPATTTQKPTTTTQKLTTTTEKPTTTTQKPTIATEKSTTTRKTAATTEKPVISQPLTTNPPLTVSSTTPSPTTVRLEPTSQPTGKKDSTSSKTTSKSQENKVGSK